MNNSVIKIERLPESRWKECRDLRLEALKEEPLAFSSSYEGEKLLSEKEWRDRICNAIFAMDNNIPVGMVVLICQTNQKTKHIANIFGLYVKKSHQGRGIGIQLIEKAVSRLKEPGQISKIKLTVNIEHGAAIALYKKIGFSVVGTLRKELHHQGTYYDELIMELLF